MFLEADGSEPSDEQKRLTFIQMLPGDIATYVSMHMELEEYRTFTSLKRFALKYVKVVQNLKRKPAPTHALYDRVMEQQSRAYDQDEQQQLEEQQQQEEMPGRGVTPYFNRN